MTFDLIAERIMRDDAHTQRAHVLTQKSVALGVRKLRKAERQVSFCNLAAVGQQGAKKQSQLVSQGKCNADRQKRRGTQQPQRQPR